LIELDDVTRVYHGSRGTVLALEDVTLRIERGQFVTVRGPSGCGKSTLLMTIGGMLRPTRGTVRVDGVDLYACSARQRAAFRAQRIGFVFQMFHLVPYLSVLDNVVLGGRVAGADRRRASELLERLGLSHRLRHKPSELSIGERQRAAIARAMMNEPDLILADEPTGNLDPDNAKQVFEILSAYHRGGGTLVVVTHGDMADGYADRVIQMRAGRVMTEAGASVMR